ncbi:MAG: hypothetical protein GY820_16880 [Gammaproteobacteria bacterium]|nr:hypothetical protein [Gammaproteobacteria bacterium]
MAERELKFTEVVRVGDRIEWAEGAWAEIVKDSRFVGMMVCEICKTQNMAIRFRRVHEPVYVFTMFVDAPMIGWCCDRNYNYIDDISWRCVKAGDIVQVDTVYCDKKGLWYRPAHYSTPQWAKERIKDGDRYMTYWTNYYE